MEEAFSVRLVDAAAGGQPTLRIHDGVSLL